VKPCGRYSWPMVLVAAALLCPPPPARAQANGQQAIVSEDGLWKWYSNPDAGVEFWYPAKWRKLMGTELDAHRSRLSLGRANVHLLVAARHTHQREKTFAVALIREKPPSPFADAMKAGLRQSLESAGATLDAFEGFSFKENEAFQARTLATKSGTDVSSKILAVSRPAGILVFVFNAPSEGFKQVDDEIFTPMLERVRFLPGRPVQLLEAAGPGTPSFPADEFRDRLKFAVEDAGKKKRSKSGWAILLPVLLGLIFVGCVACLYTEGMWGNALRLINVVTAGLLAVNFFEPLAGRLDRWQPTFTVLWDFLALWGLFALFVALFRLLTDRVSKVKVRFLKLADQIGSGVLACWIGWVMVCFTAMSLHTAPLAENFLFGGFQPQERMFMGLAPDRAWLGFVKRTSQGQFCRSASKEEWDQEKYVFDPHEDFKTKYTVRREMFERYVLETGSLRVLSGE